MDNEQQLIFLDLDGVIVDFDGGVHRKYGLEPKAHRQWDYDYENDFGVSRNEFWQSLDDNWWMNLEMYPEAQILLAMLEQYKPVILTSPPYTNGVHGKREWIKQNMPEYFRDKRYIITPGKKYVARENTILIDDKDEHVAEWWSAGGVGIMYPRPWNIMRDYTDTALEYVQGMLMEYLEDY